MLEVYQSRFPFATVTVIVTFSLLSRFLAYVGQFIKVQISYPGTSPESKEQELSFDLMIEFQAILLEIWALRKGQHIFYLVRVIKTLVHLYLYNWNILTSQLCFVLYGNSP